ncbi:hypothetical protein [Roseococcus sp. YIM B11640]|uniref:hypothetical protein n=1 Tax=Roseococcus sp. YIM B11640 TaxID=3133973 RepID=UPI003C7CCF6F
MAGEVDIPKELVSRIEALAARSNLSPSEIVADALRYGYSLDWQERFLNKVAEGIASAERGEFASPDDIMRAVNKYRSP